MAIFRNELKINMKSFLIWTLSVGITCFFFLILFNSFSDTLSSMSDAYANMDGFSAAFGMDQLSISTLTGYFSVEISTIYSLGGAMFAALLFVAVLSREEEGHTAEFLFTFPKSRLQIILSKFLACTVLLFAFNLICDLLFCIGFILLNDFPDGSMLLQYFATQLLMQIEIGIICFLVSAICKHKQIGAGLGITLILYAVDLMARVVPKIKKLKHITPFSYCNASDIFSSNFIGAPTVLIGIGIIIICFLSAIYIYNKRDLAS